MWPPLGIVEGQAQPNCVIVFLTQLHCKPFYQPLLFSLESMLFCYVDELCCLISHFFYWGYSGRGETWVNLHCDAYFIHRIATYKVSLQPGNEILEVRMPYLSNEFGPQVGLSIY